MVKRYVEMGHTDMREWSGGPWVRYSDFEALAAVLRGLLTEVEYVIDSGTIPATWLDDERPDLAIVNARKEMTRG